MSSNKSLLSLVALGITLCVTPAAQAQNILSNYGNTVLTTTTSFSNTRLLAQQFTTGGTAVTLSSATLRLVALSGKSETATPEVSLYSDAAGTPGSSQGVLGSQLITPVSPPDVTFTPAFGFALNANTSYWIVVRDAVPTTNGYWTRVEDPGTSDYSVVFGIDTVSNNSGATWDTFEPTGSYQMSLVTTAVPEANTFALALPALALIGAVLVRRRC